MNNLTKEKKQHLALVAMLTVGILVGLWFGLVNAQQTSRSGVEGKTSAIKSKIEKAEKLRKQSAAMDERLKTTQGLLQERESEMAGADPFLWFVTLMNQHLSGHPGLDKFQTVSISKPAEVGMFPSFPYRAITFTVALNSSYTDFGRFVAEFENERPFLRVQNVNIRTAGVGPTGAPVTAVAAASGERLDITFEVVALTLTNAPAAAVR